VDGEVEGVAQSAFDVSATDEARDDGSGDGDGDGDGEVRTASL